MEYELTFVKIEWTFAKTIADNLFDNPDLFRNAKKWFLIDIIRRIIIKIE